MTIAVVVAFVVAIVAVVAALAWGRERRRARELERRSREFRAALLRLGQALGSTDDASAVVEVVLETLCTLVRADAAVFWRDFGAFLVARTELGAPDVIDRRLAPGEGLVGRVAGQRDPARWPPSAVAPGASEPAAVTALAVPVVAGGRVHGVIALYRRRPAAPFSAGDLDDVAEIARRAGDAIDVGFLHEEARRLSLTDGLTGLWNRRQFEMRVTQELERATRFGDEFSIVVADIDDFKAVNDTHGHGIGDAVLVGTAHRLMEESREVDLVARLGGEEFVLVLPRTDLDGAVLAAERARAALADAPIPTDAGPVTVTLSAGVAASPRHGTGTAALLAAADQALYAAKAAGKNCVRSALDPDPPGTAPGSTPHDAGAPPA